MRTPVVSGPGLTEREMVDCLYMTGAAVEATPHVLRLVGWTLLPELEGRADENRIIVRLAMAIDTARSLVDEMKAAIDQVAE